MVAEEIGMFIALVTFLRPDKRGRSTCPQPGYHPQIDAGGECISCAIENLDGEAEFVFDISHRVALRLLLPELYQERFSVGSAVQFYEGSHLVGTGTILEVV
jgi:hypothetical protein